MEEKKAEKELKVQQWMEKKRKQAEEKEARMNELKKILDEVSQKPKEFKKAINFQDWISQKNQNFQTEKKRRDQQQKLTKTNQKCRESISAQSYTKWVSTASSKAKPVPMGKGLESLRGCSTKIYMNPEPWNEDWD